MATKKTKKKTVRKAPAKKSAPETTHIVISPPRIRRATFKLMGTAPYVQSRFSKSALAKMRAAQEAGSQAGSRRKKEARDFDRDFAEAQRHSKDGWSGIPAVAFRDSMIDACRMAGYKMVHAKMSVFIEADGYDSQDAMPLVRIHGKVGRSEVPGVLANGSVDIRVRPIWEDWTATLRVRWDEDQFSQEDLGNLLMRAGAQVGIGCGRPFSKNSAGCGWGTFEIA